ncbi:MAG: hypothetical protein KKA05_03635 [Alphaproteobacteria bacterium]|nr:hypothetical protein [Alphaproteobacteria bacterium]MBU0858892.1 hypothetical protein [Alphaproteobacteria bacterium]
MLLAEKFNATALRPLENPSRRLPLPSHLLTTTSYNEPGKLARAIRQGLAAYDFSTRDIERLNIAWPQKHPHERHTNTATQHAQALQPILQSLFRNTDVILAKSLYENIKLGRSENQRAVHALTGRQTFSADEKLQDEPLPFLTPAAAKGECFVLTDWFMAQGTTLANLASFIQHNGGYVLALAMPFGDAPFLQTKAEPRQAEAPYRGTGYAPALAAAFRHSAKRDTDYNPGECVALFNYALGAHGRSLETLTDGECRTLEKELCNAELGFTRLIEHLGVPLPAQQQFVQSHRDRWGPT